MLHNGNVEPISRRAGLKAEPVRLIVRALSDRFTGEPFPAMSNHYHPTGIPGEIGNVLLPQEIQLKLDLDRYQEEARDEDMHA